MRRERERAHSPPSSLEDSPPSSTHQSKIWSHNLLVIECLLYTKTCTKSFIHTNLCGSHHSPRKRAWLIGPFYR